MEISETVNPEEGSHFFEQLVKGIKTSLVVLNPSLKLVYINDAAENQLRRDFDQPIRLGADLSEILPAPLFEDWKRRIEETLEVGEMSSEETWLNIKGKSCFNVMDWSFLGEGEAARIVIQIRNVTEQRNYESKLLQELKTQEESIKTRDLIFSIMSHDMRAPMAQLNAMLFMFRRAPERMDGAKIAEYVSSLEEGTRHLSLGLENLLQWSSLHRSGIDPIIEPVNVSEVAEESVGLQQLSAEQKGIHLKNESPKQLEVMTDRNMLAYIQRNLMANAVKFSQVGGVVVLRQELVPEVGYVLEVEDNGIGIDKKTLIALQEAKEVITTRGTTGERGVGLGLGVCRDFAKKLGGRMEMKSDQGKGTTVRFIIPGVMPLR